MWQGEVACQAISTQTHLAAEYTFSAEIPEWEWIVTGCYGLTVHGEADASLLCTLDPDRARCWPRGAGESK